MTDIDLEAIASERDRIRTAHLRDAGDRPASSARGLHHTALISSDVERTVRFYQDLLGFPLTELIENRDYPGSSHFFFDIGNGNLLAFFDFPGLDVGAYAEVLGGLHHMAISMEPERRRWWRRASDPHHVVTTRPGDRSSSRHRMRLLASSVHSWRTATSAEGEPGADHAGQRPEQQPGAEDRLAVHRPERRHGERRR